MSTSSTAGRAKHPGTGRARRTRSGKKTVRWSLPSIQRRSRSVCASGPSRTAASPTMSWSTPSLDPGRPSSPPTGLAAAATEWRSTRCTAGWPSPGGRRLPAKWPRKSQIDMPYRLTSPSSRVSCVSTKRKEVLSWPNEMYGPRFTACGKRANYSSISPRPTRRRRISTAKTTKGSSVSRWSAQSPSCSQLSTSSQRMSILSMEVYGKETTHDNREQGSEVRDTARGPVQGPGAHGKRRGDGRWNPLPSSGRQGVQESLSGRLRDHGRQRLQRLAVLEHGKRRVQACKTEEGEQEERSEAGERQGVDPQDGRWPLLLQLLHGRIRRASWSRTAGLPRRSQRGDSRNLAARLGQLNSRLCRPLRGSASFHPLLPSKVAFGG